MAQRRITRETGKALPPRHLRVHERTRRKPRRPARLLLEAERRENVSSAEQALVVLVEQRADVDCEDARTLMLEFPLVWEDDVQRIARACAAVLAQTTQAPDRARSFASRGSRLSVVLAVSKSDHGSPGIHTERVLIGRVGAVASERVRSDTRPRVFATEKRCRFSKVISPVL